MTKAKQPPKDQPKPANLPFWKKHCLGSKDLKKYEQVIESLVGIEDVRETQFYKHALARFSIPKNTITTAFIFDKHPDHDLLLRLILASGVSTYRLSLDEN